MKKFWTYIKHTEKNDHQGISSLKQDGKLIPKANVMNDQFNLYFQILTK